MEGLPAVQAAPVSGSHAHCMCHLIPLHCNRIIFLPTACSQLMEGIPTVEAAAMCATATRTSHVNLFYSAVT